MKSKNNGNMLAVTVYIERHIGVVRKFDSGINKCGVAQDTVTGKFIYFSMDRCRKFTCGDSHPLFTNEPKNVEPKEGDILTFIIDPDPARKDLPGSMLYWNYEESYQACLADCRKRTMDTNRDVRQGRPLDSQPDVKVTEYTQMTATNGNAHPAGGGNKNSHRRNGNRCARRSGKFRQAPGPDNNWGYGSTSSEGQRTNGADVDLIKELTARPHNH